MDVSVVELSGPPMAGSGAAPLPPTDSLFRLLSGFTLMAGAGIFVIHLLGRSVLTAAAGGNTAMFATASLWTATSGLGAIGAGLVILGLSGIFADLANSHDLRGLLGSVLIALAWMVLGLFLSLYSMIVLPWLAATLPAQIDGLNSNPPMVVTFGVGLVAELAGTLLLGISLIRRRAGPAWIGYVLLASALMLVLGDLVIAPGGPATNVAVNLVSNMGPILLMVGLGALGQRQASTSRR